MMATRQRCRVPSDGRWHSRHRDHYEWCLTASEAARTSEQKARDEHLYRCGAQVRID
jgi:hypothetical protein